MINKQYKYSELTSKIIGSAIKAHKILGNGLQEVAYQRALEIEIHLINPSFSREHAMPIFYRDQQIGTRRVYFLHSAKMSNQFPYL